MVNKIGKESKETNRGIEACCGETKPPLEKIESISGDGIEIVRAVYS